MRRFFLLGVGLSALGRAQVPQGTPVHLMLLKNLGSSFSKVGEPVPLVVSQDVEVGGRIMIPQGTMVFAKVSRCRGEGALSAPALNMPARLCLDLEHLQDVDGHDIFLQPMPDKKGEIVLTREMKANPVSRPPIEFESAWENPTTAATQKMQSLFADAATSFGRHEAETFLLHHVSSAPIQQAVRAGFLGLTLNCIRDLKDGHVFEALMSLTPATRPLLAAIRMLENLGFGSYLQGRFKGRNIYCSAGVEVTAYVAPPQVVIPRPKQGNGLTLFRY